jgi:hypothetical protein
VLALAALGCGAGAADELENVDDQGFASSGECDRSPYNCKLPASPKDRNRIFNYATNSYEWSIASGTPLLDGVGRARGTVQPSFVLINYGARKSIGGTDHVYAFATKLEGGVHASGWVREKALKHGPIGRMPTVRLHDPGQGDYDTVWTVTGGNPAAFAGLKVVKDYDDGGCNATDYLARPGGVVNLLYNLPGSGGVSIDTYPLNVPFRRSRGVLELDVSLYHEGGTKVVRTMAFVYGHIGNRYGWIARDALSASGPSGACYARCCDESLQGPVATAGAAACHDATKGMCATRGHVRRSEFNGVEVYERGAACAAPQPGGGSGTGACYVRCCDGTLQGPIATASAAACHEASKGACETRGHVKRSELNGTEVYERQSACDSSQPPPPPAQSGSSTGTCYVRCCDGSLTGPIATSDAAACHEASKPVCEGRGYVKRSEFNGAEVYERAKQCYAKCKNREAYHALEGVTRDCTEHAKSWCAQGDRGGLQDAAWSQCQP